MLATQPDGVTTFYERVGKTSAPVLLLLHGIGADHAMWRPQLTSLAKAGYQLIVPDLLGHGRSSKLEQAKLGEWHAQLLGLLETCEVTTFTPVGASMGGVIAQSFAAAYPERVERLVVTDSFAELTTPYEKLLGFSQVLGFQMFRLFGRKLLARGMKATYKAVYAKQARDYFYKKSLHADLKQLILARKAINKIDVLTQLKTLDLPSLVLVGSEFGEMFISINKKIADALPRSEFVVIPEAMDPSNLVNPAAFDEHVLAFLEAHPA